jgi:hypothetical protein
MSFKEGDVIVYHLERTERIYKINWIVDTAPHLKNRADHPEADNYCSVYMSQRITRLEAPDAAE